MLSPVCFLLTFCISHNEFFLEEVRDPFVPAPDIFLLDLVVDGVAEDLTPDNGGDFTDLVNVPFAPTIPPSDEEADVEVVPEITMDPGLVPGGGGNMIALIVGLFRPVDGKPWKSVSAEAMIGVAVVVDIWSGDVVDAGPP